MTAGMLDLLKLVSSCKDLSIVGKAQDCVVIGSAFNLSRSKSWCLVQEPSSEILRSASGTHKRRS
jgi:hypothetical protein